MRPVRLDRVLNDAGGRIARVVPEGWDDSRILQIWDGLADAWDRNRDLIWSFTRPISAHLVALLDPQPGETILEVGAGTGETGFMIAQRVGDRGWLISTDLSSEMVMRARAAAERLGITNIEFRTMDVAHLDVADESVDGIVGRLVYHLVPDPVGAFGEARRALRSGGRLCLTVFGPEGSVKFEDIIAQTMDELELTLSSGLTIDVALDTPEAITGALIEAKLARVVIEESPFTMSFPDAETAWRYLTEIFGRTADLVAGLPEEQRWRFKEVFMRELEPYAGESGYDIPGLCLNVHATKV